MTGATVSSNLSPQRAAPITVKKMAHDGWLLTNLHHFIRVHAHELDEVKNIPVRFGGGRAKNFADVVFDFRRAADAYRLAEKVVAQGMKHGDQWHGYFRTPRLAILPEVMSYDRVQARADFRACTAYGEKGMRIVCPSLHGISAHAFAGMREQGPQIVTLRECWLTALDKETFALSILSSGIMPHAAPLYRPMI